MLHLPLRHLRRICLGVAALLASAAPLTAQEILYRQTFGNDQPGILSVYHEAIDWELLYASNTKPEVTHGEGLPPFHAGISTALGHPQSVGNVNLSETLSETHGFLSIRNGKSTFYTILAYTRRPPKSLKPSRIDSFEWYSGASVDSGIRVALQIAEHWYVSDSIRLKTLRDHSGIFGEEAQRHRLLLSEANWYPLTAEEGAPFAIDSSPVESLPDESLTGLGLLIEPRNSASSFSWVDSFTVYGTLSESTSTPLAPALLSTGLLAGLLITPRSRRATLPLLMTLLTLTSLQADTSFPRINIREAGAVGDGMKDDTEAFQKAIDSMATTGGFLFVPTGDYRITKTLTLPTGTPTHATRYIRIEGEGATSRLLGDGTSYILAAKEEYKDDGKRRYLNGLRVEKIGFASYNEGKEHRTGGIDASWFLRWQCSNSYFSKLATGIYSIGRLEEEATSTSVWIIRISNNQFIGCSDYAIRMERIFDLAIENNIIEHGRGGIAIGKPGDRFDAAANTIRIENNVIEGLTEKPAILGSCWIGARIAGNYFEANHGGDIELIPTTGDGQPRGIIIEANSFQPTKKQREGNYGPILFTKASNVTITGNFTTSRLIHPESGPILGLNIAGNAMNVNAAVGAVEEGNPDSERDPYGTGRDAQHWGVQGAAGQVSLHGALGITFTPKNAGTRIVRYATQPPTNDNRRNEPGSIVFNQQPRVENGRILLGWVCTEAGTPGTWTAWYGATE